jgi:hypothetical protein
VAFRFFQSLTRGARSVFSPHLLDDAGQPYRPSAPWAIARMADTNPDLERLADRLAVLRGSRRPGLHEDIGKWPLLLFLSIFFGVILFSVLLASMRLAGPGTVALMVGAGLVIASVTQFIADSKGPNDNVDDLGTTVATAILEEGICPACAYSLAGAPTVEELIRCPECGASWRADRIRRFAAIAPDGRERTLRRFARLYVDQQASGLERRRVADDRGSPRAVISLRRAKARARSAPGDLRARLLGVVSSLRPLGRARRIGLIVLFAPAGFIIVTMALPLLWSPSMITGWSDLGLLGLLIWWPPFMLAILHSDVGRDADRVREELLKSDLCPGCAHDLRAAAPQPDGCTLCEECGAAWRLPRSRA